MSEQEPFLARWSRRKRKDAEPAKPDQRADESNAVGNNAAPDTNVAPQNREGGVPAEFDPATLPPLESITAMSDVTAFLRAGVPTELTRAALRRVWTADPTIREFVGLAENAWDFTDPTAMPGFGPLEMTDDVRRMIAQVVDQIGQAAKPPEVTGEQEENSKNSSNSNATIEPQEENVSTRVVLPLDETKQNDAQTLGNEVVLHGNEDNIASQHDLTEEQEKPKQFSHRSHGGALPQ